MFTKKQVPRDLSFSETPNLEHLMQLLLTEQRHQRADLSTIKRQLHTLINSANLQSQVDEYFTDAEKGTIQETSPQTDSDER